MTRRLSLLVLPMMLGLGACSIGDPFSRPETPPPAQWSQGQADGQWPSAAWWTTFGSPELNGYMQAALTDNLDIAAAIARVREADASAKIAGASLLPTLDADLSPSRAQTPISKSGSSSSKNTKPVIATTYKAELSASYEIDFWGKNAATSESSLASARASRYDRQTIGLTTQASVADSYFAILAYQDRLIVARQNLTNAEEVLAAIRDRFQAGTATELDVVQQENVVDTLRAAVPPLEQSLTQNITALALLLGQMPEQVTPKPGSLAALTIPQVGAGLPSELLARRPDVLYAEQNLAAANADITVARAALFPSISLTAGYGLESGALNTLLRKDSILWSLAGSVTQSIFHGGALEGQVELKRARYDELVATYRKAVLSAFIDVENALVSLRKTAEEEDAERRAEATARRAYDISLDQLKGGVADITTVLNTQHSLFTAQDTLVQARLSHFQAAVSLYKVLGGGWDGKS